jgi:hypothetical protein
MHLARPGTLQSKMINLPLSTPGDEIESSSGRAGPTFPTESLPRSNDNPQSRTGTSSSKCLRHLLTCSVSLQVTIEGLPDGLLLKIFCDYLNASPRLWPRLVHTCRKWRRIVLASEQDLHLPLVCTHGTPVLKYLGYWPNLPIIVQYGGSLELDPPAPEDEVNIMAALNQSDRVHSISLTVTSSLLENLNAIKRPFSELQDFVLLSRDSPQVTLPSAFGWGTRLRRLHLTRIVFSALPLLLYSSRNLVDLKLHEVPNPWLFSPEALTDALCETAQLRSLSLHFLPTTDHIGVTIPPQKRVVFPALTHLDFRGIAKYLGDFVARIDTPRLGDFEVTFFNEPILDFSKLSEFIDRIEIQKSHRRADILSSERVISISLTQPGTPACLTFQLLCEPLAWQLSTMSRLCIPLSSLLIDVKDLHFSVMRQSREGDHDFDSERWLESITSFTGVKWFHITGNILIDIVRALQQPDRRHKTVLPSLQTLYLPQPGPRQARLREMVVSFMVLRRLSGHPIEVEYGQPEPCPIGELHRTLAGKTHTQCYNHSLTCLKGVLFLTRSRSRCSTTTSF